MFFLLVNKDDFLQELSHNVVGLTWIARIRNHDSLLAVGGEEKLTEAEVEEARKKENTDDYATRDIVTTFAVVRSLHEYVGTFFTAWFQYVQLHIIIQVLSEESKDHFLTEFSKLNAKVNSNLMFVGSILPHMAGITSSQQVLLLHFKELIERQNADAQFIQKCSAEIFSKARLLLKEEEILQYTSVLNEHQSTIQVASAHFESLKILLSTSSGSAVHQVYSNKLKEAIIEMCKVQMALKHISNPRVPASPKRTTDLFQTRIYKIPDQIIQAQSEDTDRINQLSVSQNQSRGVKHKPSRQHVGFDSGTNSAGGAQAANPATRPASHIGMQQLQQLQQAYIHQRIMQSQQMLEGQRARWLEQNRHQAQSLMHAMGMTQPGWAMANTMYQQQARPSSQPVPQAPPQNSFQRQLLGIQQFPRATSSQAGTPSTFAPPHLTPSQPPQ